MKFGSGTPYPIVSTVSMERYKALIKVSASELQLLDVAKKSRANKSQLPMMTMAEPIRSYGVPAFTNELESHQHKVSLLVALVQRATTALQ